MRLKMKNDLFSRLKSMNSLNHIPNVEIDWLIQHGNFEIYQPGLILTKGTKINYLWIILSGHISVRVDRGVGPKNANPELKIGSVTGMLPYSRLQGIPGDLYAEESTEILSISTQYFPEMTDKCPNFTAHTVHMMIDRTRIHNTSAMQDEKMLSLGKMAAGLAHELNNPISAVIRSIKLLKQIQEKADNASNIVYNSGLNKELLAKIEDLRLKCIEKPHYTTLTPVEKSDLEDKFIDWLEKNHLPNIYAFELADLSLNVQDIINLLTKLPKNSQEIALKWIIESCKRNNITFEIEKSSTQIHKLVESVKKFTNMDNLAEKEIVDLEAGIYDTLKILDSKVKSKNAEIVLDIENNLPNIFLNGAALNQVWFSLLDNALDAININGEIRIQVSLKNNQMLVRFIDNGIGISPEEKDRIFDPFYTTKAPGKGIGLGLDLSRKIIRAFKGDILVYSKKGQTEFCVYLNIEKT
jgi:signal transduction histidine kinase